MKVLFFPYLIISAFYFLFRWDEVKNANALFWFVVLFAAQWFIYGPIMVQRFTRDFKSFQTDNKLPKEVNQYFLNQDDRFFTIFIRYRIFESILFVLIAIGPIILYPEILTKNVTQGYRDIFFWIIIIFLIRLLIYCVNATAYISLLSFHILLDLQKDKIFNYNPLLENHRYAIKKLSKLSGKALRYMCTASVFLPLALYYLFQQPTISSNNSHKISFLPTSSQHPIYLFWVVAMLLFFAVFLFFSLTYQNYKIQGYSKSKCSKCLLDAQLEFINNAGAENNETLRKPFSSAVIRHTEYLKLQEIKLLCKTGPMLDINVATTYFSVLLSVLTAIQGIQGIIAWKPPTP